MKTFLAVFAAILAAAAVLFGIYSYNAAQEKKHARDLELVNLMIKASEYYRMNAIEGEMTNAVIHNSMPVELKQLPAILGRLTSAERYDTVSKLIWNYREYVDAVEKNFPDQQTWVSDMRSVLEKLESFKK